MENIGSTEWIINQIKEFEEEYENQSDNDRCMFIDGKLTILKLWLSEKIKNKKIFELELVSDGMVKDYIKSCEGKHIQQIAYSSYHDALTQVCFGCGKVRTSIKKEDANGGLDE